MLAKTSLASIATDPQEGQETFNHKGFTLAKNLTAINCSQCHSTEYDQFLRSRHAAPAWAAVKLDRKTSPPNRSPGRKNFIRERSYVPPINSPLPRARESWKWVAKLAIPSESLTRIVVLEPVPLVTPGTPPRLLWHGNPQPAGNAIWAPITPSWRFLTNRNMALSSRRKKIFSTSGLLRRR
jgi:hypothetical protein